MNYRTVIGLEIHVELATATKMFCSCTTLFGGEVNTHCCPVCTGMPGTLPVINRKAVELAVRTGLALNCQISSFSKMDRKNYFYPDLPKAYQISQYDLPLCRDGYVEVGERKIGIERIHMEEDAGKLIHDGDGKSSSIDYNRCGIPLIEIVSRPDMSNAEEARDFVEKVRTILQFIGASDCRMQEGSLRVDVNLSVRPVGQESLGIRTEMKNLNSFRAIVRAIESEEKRQIELLESGGVVIQETRRWDDDRGMSFSMRSKEEAHDYRYFPEPDLLPVVIAQEEVLRIKDTLPELPQQRKARYMEQLGLPEYDAGLLTADLGISDWFELVTGLGADPKTVSNWIMGDLMRIQNEKNTNDNPVRPEDFARLLALVGEGVLSQNMARKVLGVMFETGRDPDGIVEAEGLRVVRDDQLLEDLADKVLRENPGPVKDYLAGTEKAFGFLMGQMMRKTGGKADPGMAACILRKKLGDRGN
ncbi:MAG: Asp-tRNA(Asn)/Glu-tRNA(Gln) amidotransferase subunit GatB [Clostridia bacterium]